MKKQLLFTAMFVMVLSINLIAQSSICGAPEGFIATGYSPSETGTSHMQTAIKNKDGFATTVFTFSNITVFSYFENSEFAIYDELNNLLWSETLNADVLYNYNAWQGIYRVTCNKTFTVLVGDAITGNVNGYFAVNESGRGVSTKLNTWMMASFGSYDDFIVFAYEDNTDITVKNLETGSFIYGTSLNAEQHLSFQSLGAIPYSTPIQILSNKPISALSYTDQDYYVPSANGTFAGTLFYGYSAYAGGWANSITVTSYYNNNEIVITNSVTNEQIATMSLSEGQVGTVPIYDRTFWKVESTYPVTSANIPFGSWTGDYAYMTKAVDLSGSGAGNLFYVPSIGSRIDVFSFENNNMVKITQLGLYNEFPYANPQILWENTLAEGEGYSFFSDAGSYVYKIEGTSNVSVLQSNSGAGADFIPLSYALNLPDFSVSSSDIIFSVPDTVYQSGDNIDITFTVHNYGTVDVSGVYCEVYNNDPDGGESAPPINTATLDNIQPFGSQAFTIPFTIPQNPEYRSIYIKVDPENEFVESNTSNNKAERSLRPNLDLSPPLAVSVTAPLYLVFVDEVLTPNPFDVHYDIFNNGTGTAINVVAELSFDGALTSVSGVTSWNLGDIDVNGSAAIDVQIQANPDSIGYNYYSLTFFADNAEVKTINRMVIIGDVSSVTEKNFPLQQITTHPNPFKESVSIDYTLGDSKHVIINVFDLSGKLIQNLVDKKQLKGDHQVIFHPHSNESGLYLIYLESEGQSLIKKVILSE